MINEMNRKQNTPDYLFEVGWEVCNRTGNKYPILASKSNFFSQVMGSNFILIGPDIHKENNHNGDFIEDFSLLQNWRESANIEGLHFRIGYWNLKNKPIVILVDISQHFASKDIIFAQMWESYKLDSISGNWDYIEPALFGYAASKVIESFYKNFVSSFDSLAVHFHEWKTGLGILYLKKNLPQAALVFTAHNTVIGNAIAYNNAKSDLENKMFDDEFLSRFQIKALYSLEKNSALNTDIFCAVSKPNLSDSVEFLNQEPNLIIYNGLNSKQFSSKEEFLAQRAIIKTKLEQFISKFFGKEIQKDSTIIFHSCKDNLTIKGTKNLLSSLAAYNKNPKETDDVIYLIIGTNHPHSTPLERLTANSYDFNANSIIENEYFTHYLLNDEGEQIKELLKNYELLNKENDKVKVIIIPAPINVNDKFLNFDFYDFLCSINLGIYPLEYEPWGYRILECLASGVNVLFSSESGLGVWVQENNVNSETIKLINIKKNDSLTIVNEIKEFISTYSNFPTSKKYDLAYEAHCISKLLDWKNLINQHWLAYSNAIEKSRSRFEMYKTKQPQPYISKIDNTAPIWNKVLIKPDFPEELNPLKELSQNLWWSWDYEAQMLFKNLNPKLWDSCQQNPIALLEMLDIKEIRRLSCDKIFGSSLNKVYSRFKEYVSEKPSSDKTIAYFCMEYGLHSSVKLYSGGLGILAGDYLKEASDSNKNLIGVGLLYRYGYFNQKITTSGNQVSEKIPQKFSHLPIKAVRNENDEWTHVSIALPGRIVKAKAWELSVGRISLYLLDTDIEENSEYDRAITHQLYGGDNEHRLKQELILGIGGIRLLRKLKINPALYHLNEGHAAFLNIERLHLLIQETKLSFNQAIEVLRVKSLFTTHTPVPAGHDTFDENLLRAYLAHYPDRFNITWDKFMSLGRFNQNNHNEKFSMSVLALKLSQECNGVSRLHGEVSRKMFKDLYTGYFNDEIHISHVTNGVHYSTWTAIEWQNLLTQNKPENLNEILNNKEKWQHLQNTYDNIIWDIRNNYRKKLYEFIALKIANDYTAKEEAPKIITNTIDKLNHNFLTIGFARRFATYKRAHLLFSNPERLEAIVNNKGKEVRFVFAGKAHPQDILGQELIKKIIYFSKLPQFIGKIIFLDNYDANIALKMVQGVDVWLNTPTRPLEASGTSGEKAIMNGVLHFSVLDGWWDEGYVQGAGWALKKTDTYSDHNLQDELDAETIYNIIENEIVPAFYKRNEKDIPVEWIKIIKNNLTEIAPNFTMRRMINDYFSKFYDKMLKRSEFLCKNNYNGAYLISAWKKKTELLWGNLSVVEKNIHNSNLRPLLLGENFDVEIKINTAGIPANEVGVEILFGDKIMDKVDEILFIEELQQTNVDENIVTFHNSIEIRKPGVLNYAIRVFVKNSELPHRTDFCLVKWI